MRTRGRWWLVGLAAVAAGLVGGCGGPNVAERLPSTGASMTGEVQYDGKTLHYGQVNVVGAGSSASGTIGRDGTYTVDNVPVGEVKISVITDPGMARADEMAGGMYKGTDAKGAGKVKKEYIDVPGKYRNHEGSGLTHTVVAGVNKHNIIIPK
jgi:hypothetical protein